MLDGVREYELGHLASTSSCCCIAHNYGVCKLNEITDNFNQLEPGWFYLAMLPWLWNAKQLLLWPSFFKCSFGNNLNIDITHQLPLLVFEEGIWSGKITVFAFWNRQVCKILWLTEGIPRLWLVGAGVRPPKPGGRDLTASWKPHLTNSINGSHPFFLILTLVSSGISQYCLQNWTANSRYSNLLTVTVSSMRS